MKAFLQQFGYGDYEVTPLSADAGLRKYYQLTKSNKHYLLMDMSLTGYEESFSAFLKVCDYLSSIGVRVPTVYGYDLDQGLSVIEFFGSTSFGDARKAGVELREIYQASLQPLFLLRDQSKSSNTLGLTEYNQTNIRKNLDQFVYFYAPSVGCELSGDDCREFQSIQDSIEQNLPLCPHGLCHADYHLENLMWCPKEPQGYGLIDFQDAFWGPLPYDLLNLLEDARQTVPDDIKQEAKESYCESMSEEEREDFNLWYIYLSSHFHCRVLGLFVMLAKERNMREYLVHIPRLQKYVSDNLKHPVLLPLKTWIESKGISLQRIPDV